MKKIWFLLPLMFLGACGTLEVGGNNMDWIPIGPDFPPNKAKDVAIISGRSEITRPYGNLGLLRIKNLSPNREVLKYNVEKGRKFLASKGADAMSLGQYNSAEDGASEPKVTLIMYAIKYVDHLTPEDEKAIEDFKVLGILNESNNS